MKSFKNINILVEVKLSCLENFFLKKIFYLKEKGFFEKRNQKNCFFDCYLLIVKKKNCYLKQNVFLFVKKIFEKRVFGKNFFNLWRLKVSLHKSPDV